MAKKKRINFNQAAPDIELLDTNGIPVLLSSLWSERPLLLAFTRHFGCTQCKEMLEELVSGKQRIEAAGLGIAVVTQGSPKETAQFAQTYIPGLYCLSDTERKAYRAYGLERGDLYQTFLNPEIWKAISKSIKKGYKVETPPAGQDAMQMSGFFIISTKGLIELPYYYDHIADHPPLELLVSGVLSTRWDQTFEGPIGPEQSSNQA
jgi:peroxiredoxin